MSPFGFPVSVRADSFLHATGTTISSVTLVKQQCPRFIRLIHHKAVRNPKTALGGPWLFRAHLSPSRNHPGIRLDQLGAIWSHFAPSCNNFGPSWSHLGATLRHLETVLGPLGPTGNPECWVVEVKSGHEANPFLSILGKVALNTVLFWNPAIRLP